MLHYLIMFLVYFEMNITYFGVSLCHFCKLTCGYIGFLGLFYFLFKDTCEDIFITIGTSNSDPFDFIFCHSNIVMIKVSALVFLAEILAII